MDSESFFFFFWHFTGVLAMVHFSFWLLITSCNVLLASVPCGKSVYMFVIFIEWQDWSTVLIEDDVSFLLLDYCTTLKGLSKALFMWIVGIKTHICAKNLFVLKWIIVFVVECPLGSCSSGWTLVVHFMYLTDVYLF